jgi:hypothetical protein
MKDRLIKYVRKNVLGGVMKKGFIEKELIIYTDVRPGAVIRNELKKYGVVFLTKKGERLDVAEYWLCRLPKNINERLAKYDPELRLDTSLSFYEKIDKEEFNRLHDEFIVRRRIQVKEDNKCKEDNKYKEDNKCFIIRGRKIFKRRVF